MALPPFDDLPDRLRDAQALAMQCFPPDTRIVLFVFDPGATEGAGRVYISNAKRDDVVRVLSEWLYRARHTGLVR